MAQVGGAGLANTDLAGEMENPGDSGFGGHFSGTPKGSALY